MFHIGSVKTVLKSKSCKVAAKVKRTLKGKKKTRRMYEEPVSVNVRSILISGARIAEVGWMQMVYEDERERWAPQREEEEEGKGGVLDGASGVGRLSGRTEAECAALNAIMGPRDRYAAAFMDHAAPKPTTPHKEHLESFPSGSARVGEIFKYLPEQEPYPRNAWELIPEILLEVQEALRASPFGGRPPPGERVPRIEVSPPPGVVNADLACDRPDIDPMHLLVPKTGRKADGSLDVPASLHPGVPKPAARAHPGCLTPGWRPFKSLSPIPTAAIDSPTARLAELSLPVSVRDKRLLPAPSARTRPGTVDAYTAARGFDFPAHDEKLLPELPASDSVKVIHADGFGDVEHPATVENDFLPVAPQSRPPSADLPELTDGPSDSEDVHAFAITPPDSPLVLSRNVKTDLDPPVETVVIPRSPTFLGSRCSTAGSSVYGSSIEGDDERDQECDMYIARPKRSAVLRQRVEGLERRRVKLERQRVERRMEGLEWDAPV